MPYLGFQNGKEVIPPQVSDNSTVYCPVCDDQMYVTTSHYRNESFVSRHFRHNPDRASNGGGSENGGGVGGCEGESDVHYKMKSISYSRLEAEFLDADEYSVAKLELEGHVDGRFADVLLTFSDPLKPYGRGIAVEAQYQNKGKDIDAVTEHYFDHSYSVVWLEEDDFTSHDVDLSGILTLWPHALPDYQGLAGYPDVIQELRTMERSSVELEVPIPGEFWKSLGQPDEWITIAERNVRSRASVRIAKSPTDTIVFGLSKATPGGADSVQVQVFPEDVDKIRSFAGELDRLAFGSERPRPSECEPEWHELAHTWLTGSENVVAWLKLSLPEPSSTPILQLGKKRGEDSETVSMTIDPSASDSFYAITHLLNRAFEMERE